MFNRTEEDIAAGVIRLPLRGQEVILPTLTWAASEEWQAALQAQAVAITGRDFDGIEDAVGILQGTMDAMVDLIVAYDPEHKLGRDAADLKVRYDRAQMYEVFKAIARHEYPFTRDAEGLASMAMPYLRPILMSLAASLSRPSTTTSGPSPTGASTPAPYVNGSTSGSSASSGEPASAA